MSTFTFVGRKVGPIQISPESTNDDEEVVDLTKAKKLVVDNVVHIDGDHEDVLRVALVNSLKDAIVVSNSSLTPSERLKITASGAIHTAGNIYLRNSQGAEFDLFSTLDSRLDARRRFGGFGNFCRGNRKCNCSGRWFRQNGETERSQLYSDQQSCVPSG